jgi:hypothetical protein
MNTGHFDEISDCWSSEEQPALYYHTAAARARRLQADATTPRVKQYLDKMIAHCERLAGKVKPGAPSRSATIRKSRKGRVAAQRWGTLEDTHFPIVNNSCSSISTTSAQS